MFFLSHKIILSVFLLVFFCACEHRVDEVSELNTDLDLRESENSTNSYSDKELVRELVYPAYNQGINEARDLYLSQNMTYASCVLVPIFKFVDAKRGPLMVSRRIDEKRAANKKLLEATYEFYIRRDLMLEDPRAMEEIKESFKWVFMNLQP